MKIIHGMLVTCAICLSIQAEVLYDAKGFEPPLFNLGRVQGQAGWVKSSALGYQSAEISSVNAQAGSQAVRMPWNGTQRLRYILRQGCSVTSGVVKLSADVVPHKLSQNIVVLVCDVNGTRDDTAFSLCFERRENEAYFEVRGMFSESAKAPQDDLPFEAGKWTHVELFMDLDTHEVWGSVNGKVSSVGKLSEQIKSLKLDKMDFRTEKGVPNTEMLIDNVIVELLPSRLK